MIDSKFYRNTGPYTAAQLAEMMKLEIVNCDLKKEINGVAPLHLANGSDLTFYHNPKYKDVLQVTEAGICIIHPDNKDHAPSHVGLLLSKTPYRTYAEIAGIFYQQKPSQPSGTHPNAVIALSAKIGINCSIGAFCVIGEEVEIGDDCTLEAHTVIHNGVKIGTNCYFGSQTVVSHALIGDNVYVKCGAKIGQKGFGFDIGPDGHFSVPQLGRVIIEDNVEIGANTTVDRGASGDTIIHKGVRIDNLCQIAHNVELGDHSIIISQTGISGSTKFGKNVIAGGQSGFTGHLKIGDNARIAAQSGIMTDVEPNVAMMGSPAIKHRDFLKQQIHLNRLAKVTRS
ncbi:UDP-3-O-(3-hydroxymyristoyl)glucosamine N-acyltransferase [Candidatus Paracaedibacter symbiosus]|uniref:UDP-3-O-(3-hydroxymyristoyl)glucosamine N-acyltransferase n=1 Tax=Candidatus Paracaedibacter symbiosus TaxID=244582 RepID=UPI000509DCF5|nr:UDP-3-O-(3-hydroxymyristoyl)glucosamine N-acyltransferase [Candidatus Paracaedibacter symbiosus]